MKDVKLVVLVVNACRGTSSVFMRKLQIRNVMTKELTESLPTLPHLKDQQVFWTDQSLKNRTKVIILVKG